MLKGIFTKVVELLNSILEPNDFAGTIIDISKWQSSSDDSNLFNFDTYEASDGIYIIFKASQGIYEDKRYSYYLDEITSRVIPSGTYHFADVRYSATESAKLWASQINEFESKMSGKSFWCKLLNKFLQLKDGTQVTRHWLDIENYGFSIYTKDQGKSYIEEFLSELKKYTDVKIGIYTSKYAWEDNISSMEEIHLLDLWDAHYGLDVEYDEPTIPSDWKNYGVDWTIWQVCASCTDCNGCGAVYGAASKSIDIDLYNGTIEEFYSWIAESNEDMELSSQEYLELKELIEENSDRISILEASCGVETTIMRCTATAGLIIRDYPETGDKLGLIPYNQIVFVFEESVPDSDGRGNWRRVQYDGIEGWSADWYLTEV